MAILFGSKLASFSNETFSYYSKIFTYASFLFFGIIGFIPKKDKKNNSDLISSFFNKISEIKLNYIFIIAILIIIGELGDKTFLASLGLALEYPSFKLSLILGCICGMVCSNTIALFFGKILSSKLSPDVTEFISNVTFLIFGLIGFIKILFY